ncbi:hypothetical protein [Leifsonia sp. Leaf264]|uniref:hypothetical protein n=1 Tax=Leifsonia sp. Leaf264 TaxID=1736314 RepID=UPI0006F89856|nr:hypothetical protein [Leifsonia sp. Leaf264]KQO98310.1 hypothetical protein ASF30_09630 [Leifsonia sp. Leaf264]
MGKPVAAFSLPMPMTAMEEIGRAIERIYGTGETMMAADGDTIRVIAPEGGFGPIVTGRRKANQISREDMILHRQSIRDGEIEVTLEDTQGATLVLAELIHRWFRIVGGTNYVETDIIYPDDESLYTFTVQRKTGITPHAARLEAEGRAIAAETRVAELEAELAELRGARGLEPTTSS